MTYGFVLTNEGYYRKVEKNYILHIFVQWHTWSFCKRIRNSRSHYTDKEFFFGRLGLIVPQVYRPYYQGRWASQGAVEWWGPGDRWGLAQGDREWWRSEDRWRLAQGDREWWRSEDRWRVSFGEEGSSLLLRVKEKMELYKGAMMCWTESNHQSRVVSTYDLSKVASEVIHWGRVGDLQSKE